MINHLGNNPEIESTLNGDSASQRFWTDFVLTMEKEMPSSQFRTWIKPLAPIGLDDSGGIFVIAAPNQFKLDWIKNQFFNKINDIAKNFFAPGTQIKLIVDSQACSIKEANDSQSKNFISKSPEPDILVNDADDDIDSVESVNFKINIEDFSKLSPILTFDTFVNGKANQLARAAAIQVANNPGTSYNPMFLYGGVGLGKTHLIHAVGNYLLKQKPSAKIRYIHAEQYVSDVVRAYQQKAFDKFKSYYHSLDLLLIDDIQFFLLKSRTQEEFF
jgi:chromosomal replication initiator protein